MTTSKFVLGFGWLVALALGTSGCGTFVARQMMQAPNIYPQWLAPTPRVELAFADGFLTNFAAHFVDIGPPKARLHYRIVEPAGYQFTTTSTNWLQRGQVHFQFRFGATMPSRANNEPVSPRGTVMLLHGYGVAEFAMAPWALRLAQEGWRCVLLDLRGHGKSTGRQIFYGLREPQDLSQLLDSLSRDGQLSPPVHVLGDSFGAAVALRWKAQEPRITGVVAISPYASLSNSIQNICQEYADWTPRWLLNAGIRQLPVVLHVGTDELDPKTWLAEVPVKALFIAGENDQIVPLADVRRLYEVAASGSRLFVVPQATHETLPYFFDKLVPPVLNWLDHETAAAGSEIRK